MSLSLETEYSLTVSVSTVEPLYTGHSIWQPLVLLIIQTNKGTTGSMYWLTRYTNKECAVTLHNIVTFYTTIVTYISSSEINIVPTSGHY